MKGWQRRIPVPAWDLLGSEVEQNQGQRWTFLLEWCFLGKVPLGAESLEVMKTEGFWAHPHPLNQRLWEGPRIFG